MVEWLLVRARGTYIARTPEQSSGALAIFAPPTGLDQTKLGVGAPAPAPNAVVTEFESRRENGKASELRSEAFDICSPDWTRTSNPSINSRMLCQLSYGGLFCFRCWFPLQRVITIPGLFGLRNLKCREVHHSLGCVVGLRG